MRVVVVRHGQTESNRKGAVYGRSDEGLSDLGKEQAQRVAQQLDGELVAAIYSSDLRRCVETTEAMLPYHPDALLAYTPALREIGSGAMHRLPLRLPHWLLTPLVQLALKLNFAPPGGESWRDLRARIATILDEIYKQHPDATVLLVTHNVVIQAICSFLKGIDTIGLNAKVVPNCAMMHFVMTDYLNQSDKR